MKRATTPDSVPFLDLQAQYESIASEVDEAIRKVVESQRFVLGPEVESFEQEIASYCGAPEAVACASGSDALLLALMASGVREGSTVAVPTYTFFATAGAVWRLGARPLFVDIEPADFSMSVATLERALSGAATPTVLLPVHLFGATADLPGIEAYAFDIGASVVEDAAQAIGSADARGLRVGGSRNPACFSFFPSKNLGAYGDGGLVTCGDPDFAERLRLLRAHGARPKYHHHVVGMNSRLDALQAAILRVKLQHLEKWNEARERHALRYREIFCSFGAADSDVPLREGGFPLRIPRGVERPGRHTFHQYVVRVPARSRDELREHLRSRGIGSEVYYPEPLHLQPCFRDLGYAPGDLPESEAACLETLALPIHPELTADQIERVADEVVAYLQQNAR